MIRVLSAVACDPKERSMATVAPPLACASVRNERFADLQENLVWRSERPIPIGGHMGLKLTNARTEAS
jgi:hypothetical protein